jgi:DNA-binding response OmpR family regulator
LHHILVIDDDADICEIVESFLVEEGYAATCVHNTRSAFEAIERCRPDVILMDLNIGGGTSEEFVAAYRALSDRSAPIILMSGHAQLDQMIDRVGADGSLAKPFDLLVLLDTVEQATSRPAVRCG